MELHWERLVLTHVGVDSLYYTLEVSAILELEISIYTVNIASSKPHERLFVCQLWHHVVLQHLLHVTLQIFLRVNLVNNAGNSEHQSLFNSKVSSLSTLDFLLILIKVFNRKIQKLVEILWFGLLLFLLLSRVFAEIAQEILNLVLWLEKSLSEVVLISNVLDWVVVESSHVFLSDKHYWDYCIVEDIFNIRLQFFHRV